MEKLTFLDCNQQMVMGLNELFILANQRSNLQNSDNQLKYLKRRTFLGAADKWTRRKCALGLLEQFSQRIHNLHLGMTN